jgi:8-oxo-dGTP pyrophosphatase MutT (NUDIX family)
LEEEFSGKSYPNESWDLDVDEDLYMLVIERGSGPYKGSPAVPGGHVEDFESIFRDSAEEYVTGSLLDYIAPVIGSIGDTLGWDESPEEAIPRELEEETGVNSEAVVPISGGPESMPERVFDPRYNPDSELPDDETADFYLGEGYEDRSSQDFDYSAMAFEYRPDPDEITFQLNPDTDAAGAFWMKVDDLPKMAFTQHRVIEHFLREDLI